MQKVISRSYESSVQSGLVRLIAVLGIVFFVAGCQDKTAEEYIQQAAQYSENGDNNAAVVSLKNAVQKDIKSAKARFELGKLYLTIKNYESAEKELSRAIELGYPAREVVPLLARALERTSANVALADLQFENSELTVDEQVEVGFRQIQALAQLEKNTEAKALINDLLLLDTDSVYKGLVQGYQLVLNKQFAEALAVVKKMYDREPLNRDVLNFTARLYMINGQGESASDVFENYIAVAPDDIEAKFSLASMLVEQKQPQRAEKYIDELLEVNDTNPFLNQLKGVVRASAEDYKAAKLYSEKAISFGRTDPSLRLIAGLSSYQLEDYEAAVGHLSMVASLLPDNHPGLRILAASQLQSNMGDEASSVLSRVDQLDADDATLFSRAGYELIRSGNTDAAKDIIEQADKISESAEDLTRLGILKLSINDVAGLVDLEKAVSKAPESAVARTTLASAYLGTNQLDKAMELAKKWQQDEPSAIEGYLLEAEVLQRRELYAEASVVITKASTIDPNATSVKLTAIRLDLRSKNYDAALVKTKALLEQEPDNIGALASFFALKNEAGEPKEAVELITAAARRNPSNNSLALLEARIEVSSGNYEKALSALKSIKEDKQAPLSYWQVKGVALLRGNNADGALAHYQNWAKLYPNQESAAVGQLLILDAKREYAKGANVATDFLTRKDNLQIKIMQSYFLVMSNDVPGAKQALSQIDEKYQALPFLRGVKARIALTENRGAQAVEDALAAYDATKNPDNLFVYVSTLDAANQRDKSLAVIRKHVKDSPNDGKAKMLLAERQIKGDSDNALATYENMLKEFPNNVVALNNAAYLHMEANSLEKANEYGSRAYAIQPRNVAVADTYAQVLVRQNKIKEAVEIYNRVMDNKVSNEEIQLNYIEALLKNKSVPVAKRRIEELNLKSDAAKNRLAELQQTYLN